MCNIGSLGVLEASWQNPVGVLHNPRVVAAVVASITPCKMHLRLRKSGMRNYECPLPPPPRGRYVAIPYPML